MNLRFPSPQFDDVVAAVCHGLASEAQLRALNELLRTSPVARDDYLLRVELHSRLASEPDLFAATASDLSALEPCRLTLACSLDGTEGESKSPSILKLVVPRTPVAWAVAVAACLVA